MATLPKRSWQKWRTFFLDRIDSFRHPIPNCFDYEPIMLRLTRNVKVILNRLNQKIYILWTPWVAFSRSTSPVRTPTHHERPGDIVPGQIHLGRGDKSLKRVWILFMINIRFPMQIPWHFSLSSNLFLEHDKTKIS